MWILVSEAVPNKVSLLSVVCKESNLACDTFIFIWLTYSSKLFLLWFPVHGNYSAWSNWGTCSASCGPGVRKRTRTCTNPEPEYGGLTCTEKNLGPNVESSKCNLGDCPGKWFFTSILCGHLQRYCPILLHDFKSLRQCETQYRVAFDWALWD